MNLFKALKNRKRTNSSARWSVLFKNNDEIHYEMKCDNLTKMLGYYMDSFHNKGNPKSPWRIILRCNLNNYEIQLDKEYFQNENYPSNILFQKIESIDPGFEDSGFKEEIFIDRINNRVININSLNDYINISIKDKLEYAEWGL